IAQERALWQRYAESLTTIEPPAEQVAAAEPLVAAPAPILATAPPTAPDPRKAPRERWNSPRRLVLLVTLAAGLLPVAAIVRGMVALLAGGSTYAGMSWLGLTSAFVALGMGAIF